MGNTVDNESDDDGEEIPLVPPTRTVKRSRPAKQGTRHTSESERKKRELITVGKAKGFLTYDEVNEHMPESMASSDQMDDWLSAFSDEGIEIVDSSPKIKVAAKVTGEGAHDEEEDEEVDLKKEPNEEADADAHSTTSDPVRMYLRKMGSVALLTREGEVEVCKRIEDGERRVLQVVLNSSVAIEEILNLGDELRARKIRIKVVVRDVDEEDPDFD
jgi:RNA polymerase primary sigma factor